MNLSEFPRPAYDTGIGVHLCPNYAFPLGEDTSQWPMWLDRMKRMGVTWAKVMSGGASGLDASIYLLQNGIVPIVRLYRFEPNPGSMMDDDPNGVAAVPRYVAAGIRYFEVNNEPGLFVEWKGGYGPEWQKGSNPERVADSWLKDAKYVLSQGGLPAIPALAPGGNWNDCDWSRTFFQHIKDRGEAAIMGQGVWMACHPTGFNHDPRYPFDDVNQKGVQLTLDEYLKHEWAGTLEYVNAQRLQGKNPGQALLSVDANGKDIGASNGWLKWQAMGELFRQYFGFYIPVIGTEGGFWKGDMQDPRYWKQTEWDVSYNTRLVCEALMNGKYPDWFFAETFWILASKIMGGTMSYEHQAWYTFQAPNGVNWPVADNLMAMAIHPRLPYSGGEPQPPTVPPPSGPLSDAELVRICQSAGFHGQALIIALAICLAESGGNPAALNVNTDGSRDRGLFQINDRSWPAITDAQAWDPLANASAAFSPISSRGTNWLAWMAYTMRTYEGYLLRATAAVASALPTQDQMRNLAWNNLGIAYNKDFAFPKYAREHGLGLPRANEFRFGQDKDGKWVFKPDGEFVGQVFDGPAGPVLVWCYFGDYVDEHIWSEPMG